MAYYAKRCEDSEQALVIQWAAYNQTRHPALKWLYHIPNGGKRNQLEAQRLKAQGVKAGVSDLFLPAACAGYHGLYIEMKFGKNKLTENQEEFIHDMTAQGYCCRVAYSAEEAILYLQQYLAGTINSNV
jgi:hypothetical protein